MDKLKNNKGILLIEIIISLAIFGIIVIGFLNTFTYGYTHVINAGNKNSAVFLAHKAAEQKLAGGTVDAGIVVTSNPETITIELPNPLPAPMTQSGEVYSFKAEKNGKSATVTTFIP